MRTRAQTARDAALRRMTRVNHSLAVAALVGAGVLTDVVANTASGHAVTSGATASTGTGGVELLTSSQVPSRSRRAAVHHRSAAAADDSSSGSGAESSSSQSLQSSSAPSTVTPSQTSSSSSNTSAASSVQQQPVVAVSGGS